jgi:hypothetical protein
MQTATEKPPLRRYPPHRHEAGRSAPTQPPPARKLIDQLRSGFYLPVLAVCAALWLLLGPHHLF